jgi:N-formylglutamate amidohydrolase
LTLPFTVIPPVGAPVPVLAHVPHAATTIPPAVRREILLSDDELTAELMRMTDWYTDELFAGLGAHGVTRFVNRLSRLVFDPERFLEEAVEPTAARGQGVVYWRGSQGQPLRLPDDVLRERRIAELYRPYHAALDTLVAGLLETFGECTIIDCHSFPSLPLPSELDQAPDRPDICIGTDAMHTPRDLARSLVAAFREAGFMVKRDSPFAGTFVPSGFFGRDARVRSVMIEVRRGLYLDEATGVRRPSFASVSAAVEQALVASGLAAH